jgi:hypothetical protein
LVSPRPQTAPGSQKDCARPLHPPRRGSASCAERTAETKAPGALCPPRRPRPAIGQAQTPAPRPGPLPLTQRGKKRPRLVQHGFRDQRRHRQA